MAERKLASPIKFLRTVTSYIALYKQQISPLKVGKSQGKYPILSS